MKEIKNSVKKKIIIEESSYMCEFPGCNFSTKNKSECLSHDIKHIVKKTCIIGYTDFIWFDTANDAEKWCDYQNEDFAYNRFTNAGWYGVYHTTRSGYCGDTLYGIELLDKESIIEKWEEERDEIKDNLSTIQTNLARLYELDE